MRTWRGYFNGRDCLAIIAITVLALIWVGLMP
ncbi:hypothetical protein [Stenotrophomonas phage BUCTxx99]|nr:hypothetical protein [Stenotrophomonas phage BUCTxx99]